MFIVMLLKAHLTSHSSMFGSRWVITLLWLSGSWRSFIVQFFCVFLPPLLNIFCFCQVHIVLSFIVPIFAWNVPLVSNFMKRSLVFPILLFSSISLHWSLRKSFLSLFAIWNSAFKGLYLSFSPLSFTSLLFTTICKGFSDSHFAFLHFFFLGMVLITACCTMSWTFIQSSLGTVYQI